MNSTLLDVTTQRKSGRYGCYRDNRMGGRRWGRSWSQRQTYFGVEGGLEGG